MKKLYVAGGCFWGMEELFRSVPGVIETTAGYTGGENENPTYENHKVAPQSTIARHDFEQKSHAEALEVVYDEAQTSYWKLLDFFFQIHNPTTLNRQGNDVGM